MKPLVEIIIASDMERDDLFAEVYLSDIQVAEVINNPRLGTFAVELFDTLSKEHEPFDLDELQGALEEAKRRLSDLGYPEKREIEREQK